MNDLLQRIADIDWQAVTEILDEKGYSGVPQLLPIQNCNELIQEYGNSDLYRKTITMEKYRFGLGEYKYFKYPLPEIIQILRQAIYPKAFTYCKYMDEDAKHENRISRQI